MDHRALPYQMVGNFVLFRKLEEGTLSDLWRGASIGGSAAGTVVAIHRFKGGDSAALRQAAAAAGAPLRQIVGATIVRGQALEIADGTTVLAHEYSGGRSLRGIVERASRPTSPHPIPVDQSLAIAERISASLQALHSFREGGARLVHGALIPQFVWITEDGEVRLAGQHLAKGIIASLQDRSVRGEIGPFFAPEIHAGGAPSVAADIYSVGAILHLTLTGKPPAEIPQGGSLATALDAATLHFDDDPIPPAFRAILEKTIAPDPAQRFGSHEDFHQALTRIAAGGDYAPTTFNLAFYLHTLMKKEKEEEPEERRREQSADLAAIAARAKEERKAAVPLAAPATAAAAPAPFLSPLSQPESSRSKAPFLATAALLLVAAGAGAFFMLRSRSDAAPAAAAPAQTATLASSAPPLAPILTAVADPVPSTTGEGQVLPVATATTDEGADRKAFEDEVNRRLQTEVARLQADYEKQLAAERAKAAPRMSSEPQQTARATAAPPPAAPVTELAGADRLNQQRLEQLRVRPAEVPAAPAVEPAGAPPREGAASPSVAEEPPAAPAVREGDLIELSALDRAPSLVRSVAPEYPPFARQQKFGATVIVTVLVTETGEVAEVRVLRGDSRKLGFDESAIKAVRQAKFSPPMKDGQRVRTWLAMPVNFQPR